MTTETADPVSPVDVSAYVDAAAAASGAGAELPAAELRKLLWNSVLTHRDKHALLRETAEHLGAVLACKWVLFFDGSAEATDANRWHLLAGPSQTLPPLLQRSLAECVKQSVENQATQRQAIGHSPTWLVAAVPLTAGGSEGPQILAVASDESPRSESVAAGLEMVAAHFSLWNMRGELLCRETEAESAATLAELCSRLVSGQDLAMASHTLVNEWQRRLDCQQVVLGLSRDEHTCRLAAISGVSRFDRRSDRVRALEAALDEALVRGESTCWPPADPSDRHTMLAHKTLAISVSAETVLSCPLRNEHGKIEGAWIFLAGEGGQLAQSDSRRLVEAAGPLVASCLGLLRRAERSWVQQKARAAAQALRTRRGQACLVVALLLFASLFLPLRYKVKCDCELQPVVRRYVAAPFDATLERSHVEPGDLVSQDQLLAQIDGREVRWELAGVAAERTRASKQRDGHLATHEFGSAQVAHYDMERLDLKAKLLEHRGENLEIRSPLDGIVISGDLKKAEGVPLTVGQTLFEVAPLDSMIVEIAVPEEDVRHVSVGSEVDIVLDAFPREKFRGSLSRIHPRSEVLGTEHVFVGEFELENPLQLLRPGMQGKATIVTDRHPLVWNLFHKPWEKLLYWMGW